MGTVYLLEQNGVLKMLAESYDGELRIETQDQNVIEKFFAEHETEEFNNEIFDDVHYKGYLYR